MSLSSMKAFSTFGIPMGALFNFSAFKDGNICPWFVQTIGMLGSSALTWAQIHVCTGLSPAEVPFQISTSQLVWISLRRPYAQTISPRWSLGISLSRSIGCFSLQCKMGELLNLASLQTELLLFASPRDYESWGVMMVCLSLQSLQNNYTSFCHSLNLWKMYYSSGSTVPIFPLGNGHSFLIFSWYQGRNLDVMIRNPGLRLCTHYS